MAKDWEDLSWHKQDKKLLQMAEQYGVDPGDYARNERESGAYGGKGDWDDFTNAVLQAGANDYDTRRSIEAGKASGNKRFDDIGDGISNIGELYAANSALKNVHKKDMGNTGNFGSANDYGNVTNYLNNEYEQSFKDDILEEVYDSIPKKDKNDDDDEEVTVAGPSYIDHFGLDEEIAKATAGYNADGTPAGPRLNAQSFLSKAVKDAVYGPQDVMDKAHNNQDQYALTFDGSQLQLNPGVSNVTLGIGLD